MFAPLSVVFRLGDCLFAVFSFANIITFCCLEVKFIIFIVTIPYKNSKWLNEIGERLDSEFSANYLYSDFKKKNGYKRSIELSNIYDLYRQDYCGCIYSLRDKIKKDEYNNVK